MLTLGFWYIIFVDVLMLAHAHLYGLKPSLTCTRTVWSDLMRFPRSLADLHIG